MSSELTCKIYNYGSEINACYTSWRMGFWTRNPGPVYFFLWCYVSVGDYFTSFFDVIRSHSDTRTPVRTPEWASTWSHRPLKTKHTNFWFWGFCTVYKVNFLRTLWESLWDPSSMVIGWSPNLWPLKMGPTAAPEATSRSLPYTPYKIPKTKNQYSFHCESLKWKQIHTSVPSGGSNPATPAIQLSQTYVLDRRATGIGHLEQ
jgi:hypothetical protein